MSGCWVLCRHHRVLWSSLGNFVQGGLPWQWARSCACVYYLGDPWKPLFWITVNRKKARGPLLFFLLWESVQLSFLTFDWPLTGKIAHLLLRIAMSIQLGGGATWEQIALSYGKFFVLFNKKPLPEHRVLESHAKRVKIEAWQTVETSVLVNWLYMRIWLIVDMLYLQQIFNFRTVY